MKRLILAILPFIMLLVILPINIAAQDFFDPHQAISEYSTNSSQSESPAEEYLYEVRITLSSGQSVRGVAVLNFQNISVQRNVEGIDYVQTIPLEQIAYLYIEEWSPSRIPQQNQDNSSVPYIFYPSEFRLVTKSGDEIELTRRIAGLDSIRLANNYGTTVMYSLFYDYWINNGEDQLMWNNNGMADFQYNNTHPNERSIRMIEFFDIIDESDSNENVPQENEESADSEDY